MKSLPDDFGIEDSDVKVHTSSSIAKYNRCPKLWSFYYKHRVNPPESILDTNEAISIGSCIHEAFDSILTNLKFKNSGCTNSKCALEIGKLINADLIVIGTVSNFKGLYSIDTKLINIKTEEITKLESYFSESDERQLFKEGVYDNMELKIMVLNCFKKHIYYLEKFSII